MKLAHACLQLLVIDYRLTFPSGSATGIMIKGFHTPLGEKLAMCGLVSDQLTASACSSLHSTGTDCACLQFPRLHLLTDSVNLQAKHLRIVF